jgi:hypothetical protein
MTIAQHVVSFEALDRPLEAISEDTENYHRCVARERRLEIEVCREMGVPCFLILDTPETRGIHIAGHGQDPLRKHLLYDLNREPVDSLTGEVLLRTSVSHERSCLEFIEQMGGVNVADWASQVKTQEWYKHVRPEYLKRRMGWFRLDEVPDLSGFRDANGQFFAKTSFKGISGLTDSLTSLLGYDAELMPPSAEIVASEPVSILTDERGKREYRCFVVRGKVSSVSRYIDYDTDYEIPGDVEAFASAFVADHGNLPDCYVLDVAETERGLVVIELNGIVASGRYERNCFRRMVGDFVLAS